MTAVDTVQRPLSLAERAAKALGRPAPAAPEKVCLLLDVSGSMDDRVDGAPKIDLLREVVRGLDAPAIFAFAAGCKRVTRETIPNPHGGTALHRAFLRIKSHAYTRAVIITDGLPDDEDAALREVVGLSVEIMYVGPAPKPAFLDRLAAAARAGSQAHQTSLASRTVQERVRLMLAAGR